MDGVCLALPSGLLRKYLAMHLTQRAALLLGLLAAAAAASSSGGGGSAAAAWWRPQRGVGFNYMLSDARGLPPSPGVQVYAVDLDEAAGAGPRLRAAVPGARIICYFSAGSWERDREGDDASRGPNAILPADWAGLLGKTMDHWPAERWVDIR